jgi:replicative DNA helicase
MHVLVPTRELAKQVGEVIQMLGRPHRMEVHTFTGGTPYPPQERALRNGIDVLVGTPGRIIDHLNNGGLLLDNQAWDKIADLLSADDFYRYDHRLIFAAIGRLIDQSRPADVITVFESLQNAAKDADAGGLPYLNALAQNTPSAANIRRYGEIVRDRAVLRRLVSVGEDITTTALNPQGKETKQILDEAESAVFQIAEAGARGKQGFARLDSLLVGVVERIQELYETPNASDVTGVPTGYVDIDKMTAGLQKGDLIIVAGRPSMGKTTLAVNIAEHVAIDQGMPVLIFSMEMGAPQLALRMLSSVGRIDQQRLRTGRLLDEDWPRLTATMQKMHDAQMYIDESPALNSIDLRARARRQARVCGQLGLIVIDYLQLMSANGQGENRATEISEISRSLKALAKELKVPVIALSQLNRTVEQRTDKRPVMSDLRESGAIEQDADVIFALYREEFYNPDTPEKGVAEVLILKQRNGPTGRLNLRFAGALTRFDNLASGSSVAGAPF